MPENSALLDEVRNPAEVPDVPDYSQDEIDFLKGLQVKLERARTERDGIRDEFDGMGYPTYWESNEKGANTFIEPRKNKEDSTYQSGTIRRKIFAFVAELLKLDWFSDVTSFNQSDIESRSLGNAVEDAIAKAKEIEGDDEKRLLRFYELLKQGDIFILKEWDEQFEKKKQFKGNKFDGKVSGISITTKLKRKLGRIKTSIISGMNVYPGNIRVYDWSEQPYIAIVDVMDYAKAEGKYSKWERWPYVSKTLREFSANRERGMVYNNWRMLDFQKDKVERVIYMDKFNNEIAIVLNGVLMTPVGLPLSAAFGYDDYNLVNQHLKPINANFAYGSSLVKEAKANVAMYDDLIRLMHLRTRQALWPARFNLTGRTVSSRVFMPAAITAGLNPKDLPLADERAAVGIGASEYKFTEMLMDNVDKNTVGAIPSAETPGGDPTATEILTVSAQAKTMLLNVVIACTLLEWKLSWQNLYLVLAKWFDPTGDKVDEARQQIVKSYRTYGVSRPIDDLGMGRRVTVPMSGELPSAEQVKEMEDGMYKNTGVPYRFTFLNPEQIEFAKWTWQITIRPKPKANDEMSKVMFNKMVADALQFFGPDVNLPALESEYAVMWDRDPKKFFKSGGAVAPQQTSPGEQTTAPGVKMPTPGNQMQPQTNLLQ